MGIPHSPAKKELEHPNDFPSMLRKNDLGLSVGSLTKRDNNANNVYVKRDLNKRDFNNSSLKRDTNAFGKRDSLNGSTNSLKKDYLQVPNVFIGTGRRNSRRLSSDSLDGRRNSWDPSRRGSSGSSCGWDEPIWEDNNAKVNCLIKSSNQHKQDV